jgi:hypothetical protein
MLLRKYRKSKTTQKNPGALLSQLDNDNTQSENKLKHVFDIANNGSGIPHHIKRSQNLA